MSQLEIEDESRPCCYPPCTGRMTADLDGECVVWECGSCGNETYAPSQGGAPDACQVGVSAAAQQRELPGAPVFLGQTIGRRPQ